jgi:hypothetical protein
MRFGVCGAHWVDFKLPEFLMARVHIVLFATLCVSVLPLSAFADLVASDNASSTAYNDGWQEFDNGGSGFNAWSPINRDNGSGDGGGFLSTGNGNVNIGTGGNNAAWGVYGNNGGVGQAIRAFPSPMLVGMTFNIDMDNQGIDPGGTVGFGLRNSSGDNLFEFFFVGGQSNYTVNASNVSGTTPGFTSGGLRLALHLNATNAFSLTIDTLDNGVGVDNTVTGNLLNSADQQIHSLRLFNANGGPDVFFNSISAVPEVSPMLAVPAAALVAGTVCFGWRRWRAKPAVAEVA